MDTEKPEEQKPFMGYIEKKMSRRVNITNIVSVKGRSNKLQSNSSNLVEVDIDNMSSDDRIKYLNQLSSTTKREEEKDLIITTREEKEGINFDSLIKTVSESSLILAQ